jgi:hypothetical protein
MKARVAEMGQRRALIGGVLGSGEEVKWDRTCFCEGAPRPFSSYDGHLCLTPRSVVFWLSRDEFATLDFEQVEQIEFDKTENRRILGVRMATGDQWTFSGISPMTVRTLKRLMAKAKRR